MSKSDQILRIIEELIDSGIVSLTSLGERTHIRMDELMDLIRDLEFLDAVVVKEDKVYLSSHIYSLLFDAIVAEMGLKQYFETRTRDQVIGIKRTIPGLLVPTLLLRAANPYFGLILRELLEKREIRITRDQMNLLLRYFSLRKLEYDSIKNWSDIDFSIDEFYELWIILNKELSKRIVIQSPPLVDLKPKEQPKKPVMLETQTVASKSPKRKAKIETKPLVSEEEIFRIPKKELEKLFGLVQETEVITNINKTNAPVPSDLKRIAKVEVSMPSMINFINEQKGRSEGLEITIYDKAIRWKFSGTKRDFPTMFLLEDGIYIDQNTEKMFSEQAVSSQVSYLEKCVETSRRLYGLNKPKEERKDVKPETTCE